MDSSASLRLVLLFGCFQDGRSLRAIIAKRRAYRWLGAFSNQPLQKLFRLNRRNNNTLRDLVASLHQNNLIIELQPTVFVERRIWVPCDFPRMSVGIGEITRITAPRIRPVRI